MPKKETKVHRVSVLLTFSQQAAIKAAADAAGLDLSAFIRQAAYKEAAK